MPFARCRYYTESGEPVRDGCRRKGAGCAFVHPDDPNWDNAPPSSSSFKGRDKSGGSGSFKSWDGKRGTAAPSAWDSAGNAGTTTADTGSGWGAVNGWSAVGEWGTGSGWEGTGWGTDAPTSTSNRVPESAQSDDPTKSKETFAPAGERSQRDSSASGNPKISEHGWGGNADGATGWGSAGNSGRGSLGGGDNKAAENPTGSGWGSTGNDGCGSSSWGGNKAAEKTTGSGWGSTENNGCGSSSWGGSNTADKTLGSGWGSTGNDGCGPSSWGGNKTADKTTGSGWGDDGWGSSSSGAVKNADKAEASGWGSTQNGAWGSGWGNNKDAANTWGAPEPMLVDDQREKEALRPKGKGKAVPPPRIRIPDNENKKNKTTGTNNVSLGPSKWAEPCSSNLVTTVTTSTPITMVTPTDESRLKRKRDAASEDNFDVFKEYIKTWERGVRARFLLAEAEAKRGRWFRTQKSSSYARIGEAGRKKLDGQRAECDKEVNLQREKLSSAITLLVGFHDTFSTNLDLGQRYKIGEETEKFISESKAFVDEVRALLVAHVLKDKNDAQSGGTQRHTSESDSPSIDSLRNQLRALEERFDQAQTELTLRRQRNIRSEIDDLLAAKIATLHVARQREVDRVASQPRAEIVIPPNALESMENTAKQVKELDTRVPHTVEAIRVLLLRVDATTKRVNELEEELSKNKATYGKQVQTMATEKEEAERRIDERLKKIKGQFDQLGVSRPGGAGASPATSPTIDNSQDKLMQSLRPAFEAAMDDFYGREVQPTIESLQQIVTQASNRHSEEAMKVLWGKMQPAMNMVAGVCRWLDSQELALTAPVEGDNAYTR